MIGSFNLTPLFYLSLSISFPASLHASHSLPLSIHLVPCLSPYVSFSASLYPSLSLPLSIHLFPCLSPSISFPASLILYLPHPLYLSLPPASLALSFSLSPPLLSPIISGSLSLPSLPHSVYRPLLSPIITASLSLIHPFILSVCPSIHPSV